MEKVCLFNHVKNINISQVNIQIIFGSKGKNTLKMAVNRSLFQHLVHNQLQCKLPAYQLPQNHKKIIDLMTNFEYAVHQKTDIIFNN
jgi:hypothetical protein